MDEKELLEKIKTFKFWTGKSELSIEDIAMILALVLIPSASTFGHRRPGARAPAWAAKDDDVVISFGFGAPADPEVEALDDVGLDPGDGLELDDDIDEVEQDA